MSMAKTFWKTQTSSMNRHGTVEFYRLKAEEHAGLLAPMDRSAGIVDLGCGAGELLEHMVELVKVEAGLDFSDSMLNQAHRRLVHHPEIKLVNADLFEYLPENEHAVWITTGGINQYLDRAETLRFLEFFAHHTGARALYLFDCIDPLRFSLLPYGLLYHLGGNRTPLQRMARRARFAGVILKLASGGFARDFQYLGSPVMGYGAQPRFWLQVARRHGLNVQIVSSRYYEYRYHVVMRKTGADDPDDR